MLNFSVLREQRDRLDEQRREQQARLQQQEKKFDHLIRAYHLQEMVARRAISNKFAVKAPQNHDSYEKRRIENAMCVQIHCFYLFYFFSAFSFHVVR